MGKASRQFVLLLSCFVFLTGAVRPSIPEVCIDTVHKNVITEGNYIGVPTEYLESGSIPDIIKALEKNQFVQMIGSWILQDVSRPAIAQAAFYNQALLEQKLVDRLAPNSKVIDVLKKSVAQPAHYSSEAVAQAKKQFAVLEKTPVFDSITRLKIFAGIFCTPYFDLGCPGALRDLADVMGSRASDAAAVSLMPVVKRVLLDDTLVQGSAHFALKILARVKAGKEQIKDAPQLLQDIIDSFIATGSTRAQAEDRAWVLIGMYGSRGASLDLLRAWPNSENLPVFLNLYIFSSVLALFDGPTVQTGLPYSAVPSVKTFCAYRLPYHFWLSAYLTRYLIKKGHNPRSAVIATHLAAKLYEFASPTVTRDIYRPYLTPLFGPYNMMIRTNIAFDDAGAFYAASGGKNAISVDEGLTKIIDASKPMPKLSREELKRGLKNDLTRYGWFHRIMAPDIWIKNAFEIQETDDNPPYP